MRAVIARLLGREDSMLPLVAPAKRRRAYFATREDALSLFRGRGGFKTWPSDDLIVDYIQGGTVPEDGGVRLTCAPAWEAANFKVFPFGLAKLGRHVHVPLTVLHADKGSSAPTKVLDQLARVHGNAHVVRVEGTTHFLPMERPDVVRAEIIAAAERAGLL
jgi:pimeloyl-ACP methyl ester carboxylesterase